MADPQKELQKKWDATRRRSEKEVRDRFRGAMRRKALAFLEAYFEKTQFCNHEHDCDCEPTYTEEQIEAVMGLYTHVHVLQTQLDEMRASALRTEAILAKAQKQISDHGWEKDQASPHRMGL